MMCRKEMSRECAVGEGYAVAESFFACGNFLCVAFSREHNLHP